MTSRTADDQFELLASSLRNNRLGDLEAALDAPECLISINSRQSNTLNTLIHIAVQNGIKQEAKAFPPRGMTLTAQNARGNSALHFCYAFGHTELGQYLISKGADDSIRNADGLTCFEGLSISSLSSL